MTKFHLLLLGLFVSFFGNGQNTHYYYQVQLIDECGLILTLDQSDQIVAGQKLLLIQSTGGDVSRNLDDTFGNFQDDGFLGNNEIVQVDDVQGNQVYLKSPLVKSYNTDFAVQLVNGVYSETDVALNTAPVVTPFDGQKGGVMFIYTDGNLTINTDLSVDGLGYEGATMNTSAMNCSWLLVYSDYGTDENSGVGANKGMGPVAWEDALKSGRGKWANGGGGGNDHNSGGGGGGGYSAGGKGGARQISSAFNCSGNYPGEGGEGLGLLMDEGRLVFGGGGGSGHNNNAESSDGGDGGGILFIHSNRLIANSVNLSANGKNITTLAGDDGAAGGGGGGNIILDFGSFVGDLNVAAKGGKGGDGAGSPTSCAGAGAGGGGGAILLSLSEIPAGVVTDVNGGSQGIVSTCSMNNPTTEAGEAGAVLLEIDFSNQTQTVNAGLDQTICSGEVATLTGVAPLGSYWSPGSLVLDSLDMQTTTVSLDASVVLNLVTPGNCEVTDSVTITVETCTSLNNASQNFIVVLDSRQLKIEGLNSGDFVEMYDAQGKLVFKSKVDNSFFLNSFQEPLSQGAYFLKISGVDNFVAITLGVL